MTLALSVYLRANVPNKVVYVILPLPSTSTSI